MAIIRRNLAARLHNMENGIRGALGSEAILTKMALFGYTKEKIEHGLTLLNEAKRLTASQVGGYGDQFAASDEVQKHWTENYSRYMITVKVVRIAFKARPDLLAKFKVTGERNRSLSGWLNDARIMYANILNTPEALGVLANYGYSLEKLSAERDGVEEVEALHSKRLAERSEAQQGTFERDKAIDALCNWYSDFRAIARVALYDSTQMLEALGITRKN